MKPIKEEEIAEVETLIRQAEIPPGRLSVNLSEKMTILHYVHGYTISELIIYLQEKHNHSIKKSGLYGNLKRRLFLNKKEIKKMIKEKSSLVCKTHVRPTENTKNKGNDDIRETIKTPVYTPKKTEAKTPVSRSSQRLSQSTPINTNREKNIRIKKRVDALLEKDKAGTITDDELRDLGVLTDPLIPLDEKEL